MSNTLLSILILTYNDGKFLEGCLNSIREHVSCFFEVILVHNGSSEPVPEGITDQYPWLRLIRSEKNLGFNAGNNLAAKNARGDYILLLNIDTVLLTDVVPAIRLLESDRRIGVVGAKAHRASLEPCPSAGHFPKAMRLWYFRSLWSTPRGYYGPRESQAHRVDWVEGSFLMTTAENWKKLGGLDEKNFYYRNPILGKNPEPLTDVDFCRRSSARGLGVVQCSGVKYVHFCGFGVGEMGHLYAGFRCYHRKFSSPLERLVADIILRVGLMARISVYGLWYGVTKNAHVRDKFRSFVNVHKNWARTTP
jgi:GT2 family glycosyltransferase